MENKERVIALITEKIQEHIEYIQDLRYRISTAMKLGFEIEAKILQDRISFHGAIIEDLKGIREEIETN